MKKKIVCWLLVIMITGLMTSCVSDRAVEEGTTAVTTTKAATTTAQITTGKTQSVTTTTKQETTTVEKNPFEERLEITWLKVYTQNWEEGRWDELELEEKFNVDLKVWTIYFSPSDMSQVDMMLAAGDCPDFGYYYRSGRTLIEQDLARTVPREFIEKYLPSYAAILNDDPVGWQFNKVTEEDTFYREGTEEYIGLTMLSPLFNVTRNLSCWRLDWLENLGYHFDDLVELPVDYTKLASFAGKSVPEGLGKIYMTNYVFNFDEVNEIYRAFTEDDPDGNGIDDTYAAIYTKEYFSRPLYGMFGINLDANYMFYDETTKNTVPYFAHPGYRDYLAWVSEMMEKGYMRPLPQIESAWWSDYGAAWNTGKVGFISTTLERLMSESHVFEDPQQHTARIVESIDSAQFLLTQVPDGPGYEGANIPYATFQYTDTYNIGKTCSDEKLMRLFALLEYAYYGEEWTRYKFGIEGVHYTWMGEPFKSAMVKTPAEKIPKKYVGPQGAPQSMFGNDNFSIDLGVYYNYTSNPLFYCEYAKANGWFETDIMRPYKYFHTTTMPKNLYDKFTEIRNETLGSINTVHNDLVRRFEEGQIANILTEWSTYIDQLYANGLDLWVEIFNDPAVPTYNDF